MNIKSYLRKLSPPETRFRLMELKKRISFDSYQTKTYSGDSEDIVLSHLFPNQMNGYYVDVGCFHPKLLSNTYSLHKRGWSGVNIDPNPEVISLFKKYRPNDINIQIGIAKISEEKKYYNFANPGVNTFDDDHAENKAGKAWNDLVSTTTVTCRPLSEILSEHAKDKQIDVLDVDVEGMDLEVLESNDWSRFQPKVVLVEDRDFRTQMEASQTYRYLSDRGYKFHCYNNITLIMVRST